MYGKNFAHDSPPVVIDNLYIMGVCVAPDETDSPLIVYSYAMLSLPAAG